MGEQWPKAEGRQARMVPFMCDAIHAAPPIPCLLLFCTSHKTGRNSIKKEKRGRRIINKLFFLNLFCYVLNLWNPEIKGK